MKFGAITSLTASWETNHITTSSPLEYGHHHENIFTVECDPDPMMRHDAFYTHQIIRRYNQGELVANYHINDDLEYEWIDRSM